ncbi:hypothetical protein KK083_21720 [Fulvivirgaceae bacterium PWU4]|uniref:Uncharacterized protein n=1 Tax=Chryseosolibacter histidini TaxID=2782349 RepID=A0AAP2GRF6_9BACT|nr:hypothetical protein [Chryseosolibacter histidini]MBT1699532.1 hypothetical protein [Chryseosolibacter histidini]
MISLLIVSFQLPPAAMAQTDTTNISIRLTISPSEAFWKVYRQYETAYFNQLLKANQLAADYAACVAGNDAATHKVFMKWLKNDIAGDKLKKRYYKKFKRVSSPRMASAFIRRENNAESEVSRLWISTAEYQRDRGRPPIP